MKSSFDTIHSDTLEKKLLMGLLEARQEGLTWARIGDILPNTPRSKWNQIATDLFNKHYIEFPSENNTSLAKITSLGIQYLKQL